MNYELATRPELVALPKVKVVGFEDLNIDYDDRGSLGLEDTSVTLSQETLPSGITQYQAVFDIEFGPKKLKNLLTHAAPPPERMLRLPDTFKNFTIPNAMQNMYDTHVLDGKPIEPGHQLANLEALRKQASPIMKADMLEPEDIVGQPFTPMYTLRQVQESLQQQGTISPPMLKELLFSNLDTGYRKRLLEHVNLKRKYHIDRVTKEKTFYPKQQERAILKRFEQTPNRLSRLLETFPPQDIKHLLEQYAFMNFGGYLDTEGEEEKVIFGVGPRQEITNDTGEFEFTMGNMDITAQVDIRLGTYGRTPMIIPTSASLRKYIHAGLTWNTDSLANRQWDLGATLPERTNPLLGITMLAYIEGNKKPSWHPNFDLMTPSYAAVLAAIDQKRYLGCDFLSAAESMFR